MIPTQDEYDAAKARQLGNPAAFRARKPSKEVLADVAVINAYEAELERKRVEQEGTS